MNRVRRIALWSWRAWPFIMMIFLIGIHQAIVSLIPSEVDRINKWVSAIAQIVGGGVVILSFSKNLGSFGKGGLRAVFIGWYRAFPWSPRVYIVTAEPGHINFAGNAPTSFLSGGTRTLEQRVADAEKQIQGLTSNLEKVKQEIESKFGQLKDALSKSEAHSLDATAALNDKVTQTVVDGLMPQVFGFLLITSGVLLGAYMQP